MHGLIDLNLIIFLLKSVNFNTNLIAVSFHMRHYFIENQKLNNSDYNLE